MLKKYFPLLLLVAALILFIWIKTHQRGHAMHIPVDTVLPSTSPENSNDEKDPFDRNTKNLNFSKHARCRMDCRHIDESEVREILQTGVINYNKIEDDARGKAYPLEGVTHDKQHVRVVFAPHQNELVVVTVIDLDSEWQCNCN